MTSRRSLREIADWTIPPAMQQVLQTLRRKQKTKLTAVQNDLVMANRALHNRHSGQRCFILATGPSIAQQNLKLLANEVCIGVSNFFVHADYAEIHPRYHCIAAYHLPITKEGWLAWLQEMSERTGKAEIFFHVRDESIIPPALFKDRTLHFVQYGRAVSDYPAYKTVDLTQPLLSPQSVTITALQIAIYMGFREIYLLGVDHDWILNLNVSRHFYQEQEHALNRHGYNEWFNNTELETAFWDYIHLWEQYKLLNQIALSQSTQIYNATTGGLLDVYPRVDFDKLV